jgi:hypothetical protein
MKAFYLLYQSQLVLLHELLLQRQGVVAGAAVVGEDYKHIL